MSEQKAYRCDGPRCEVTELGTGSFGNIPETWYQLWRHMRRWHFHDATCLRRFAEQLAPVLIDEGEASEHGSR